jgi:hypothetical protein
VSCVEVGWFSCGEDVGSSGGIGGVVFEGGNGNSRAWDIGSCAGDIDSCSVNYGDDISFRGEAAGSYSGDDASSRDRNVGSCGIECIGDVDVGSCGEDIGSCVSECGGVNNASSCDGDVGSCGKAVGSCEEDIGSCGLECRGGGNVISCDGVTDSRGFESEGSDGTVLYRADMGIGESGSDGVI